jgi:hypothetical protein
MTNHFVQLSFQEIYNHCINLAESNNYAFFELFDKHIHIDNFISQDFYFAFYKKFGRNRKYQLSSFLRALIFQKIISIPSDSLLISFLKISKELREFCGFNKVPDPSKITRFKQTFFPYIEKLFISLVDITEPICKKINPDLASILILDTSGIEPFVKENNFKFFDKILKQFKAFHKSLGDKAKFNPYQKAYESMPDSAAANDSIKKMFINGHFSYAFKFSILSNALGIPRHIAFLDDTFKNKHSQFFSDQFPSLSPDSEKYIGDSSALQPVLKDFFSIHPNFHYNTFLADAAFDKIEHYNFLKNNYSFDKILIPLNPRNSSKLSTIGFNSLGYPLCPNDSSLPLKRSGITREKNRPTRIQWRCPLIHMQKGVYTCSCKEPCSSAKKGRTVYTYDDNIDSLRLFPGIQRGSDDWVKIYKHRTIIERTIDHLKINMCTSGKKTRNLLSTKSDVLLASITSLFTVIIADSLNKPNFIRSIKSLIA